MNARKKRLLDLSIAMFLSAFLLCFALLGSYAYGLHQDGKEFRRLDGVLQKSEEESFPAGFKELKAENPDLAGWVRIEGTGIDYPVMHTPKDEEYYLRRNFSKETSLSGTPFADKRVTFDPRADNVILYGHNMKNGSLFSDLLRYREEAFLKEHPEIVFYTPEEKQVFRIVAVVPTQVYAKDIFDCYSLVQAKSKEEFDTYVAGLRRASLYPFEEEIRYGDQLLTLSTCAYHVRNGRFVVVGKREGLQ